ncbi:MAG: hypothetical protein WA477_19565 [Candidatus Sulfotelmatobacter sp.]
MKTNLDRIISVATLLVAMVAIVLVLKRPAPTPVVVMPQPPATVSAPAQSGNAPAAPAQPTEQGFASSTPAAATAPSQPATTATSNAKADPRINSDEISSAVAKMLGGGSAGAAALSPDSNVGSGEPTIKDQQVTMDGDVVHGKFLTTIAGKDVWVTISGHMGEKDGYATFDPTEFKVGDMNVPVSLVNPALQRKLSEERDRLKVPNN